MAADADMWAAEEWVRLVAKKANAMVDWHYSGGVVQVLHLGDAESRARVEVAIDELAGMLKGRILRRYEQGESGLYRNGVSDKPPHAIATFSDNGDSAFIVHGSVEPGGVVTKEGR
jgi:hypothetical protein